MYEAQTWYEPDDVNTALNLLGLKLDWLVRSLALGSFSYSSRTANDARSAAGFYVWNEIVKYLSEELIPQEWVRSDDRNLPILTNAKSSLRIIVSSGDESTGIRARLPSSRNPKGRSTLEKVLSNIPPLSLFEQVENQHYAGETAESEVITWVLLFHIDKASNVLRAELSLPVAIDYHRKINLWNRRIILPESPLNGSTAIVGEPDFGPDVTVKVVRKP